MIKRLFWDIEVSPNIVLAWRAGWKERIPPENIIYERAIICICYKWQHEKQVHSLQWNKKQCDGGMVKKFAGVMEEADEIVGHNIDKYDLKFFNQRAIFHKIPPPRIPKTVDTLAIARRRFAFNSNKLDYISQYLGHDSKHKTEYDMWKKILMESCDVSMDKMVKYCKQDVRITQKVYEELQSYHNPKTHAGVVEGRDKWSCPECGSEKVRAKGWEVTRTGVRRKLMACMSCARRYSIPEKTAKEYMEWRADQ
jgi:hypothetical protein